MADQRARYFRRLRSLRRSARWWSVWAGGLGGAAVVLTPYQGLGLPDAAWVAGAGGTAALALWRWADLRLLAAQPAPPPPDPALAAERTRAQLIAAVERLPAGAGALAEVRRQKARFTLRGSAAAEPWNRLSRASATMTGLAGRLPALAGPAVLEATVAETSLHDLAHRVASLEKAMRLAPDGSRPALESAHRDLCGQLDRGVTAYEALVVAAAAYLAEDTRSATEHPAATRLTEATDLLHGIATGLSQLRTPH
ncbi:phage shock envelope stress response protein PspM [Micromonospora sp. NPDC004704]